MAAKTSSYYQTRYRERLRQQGFVKREVWIPPDATKVIKDCEMALRGGVTPIIPRVERKTTMSQQDTWTTLSLLAALKDATPVQEGEIDVELIEGADPSLLVTMKEFGDLPLYVSISGSQIIVDTLLWPVAAVKDTAAFNMMLLRTHKLFPLSTFGITQGPDGQEYYEVFGSLSAASIFDSVLFEIETLADTAIQAVEAYQSDLELAA